MKNLAEKALLVTLSISHWSARKYDRKVTQEVNTTHNSTDAGRFNKLLIGKDHLVEINKIVTEARDYHYKNTLPWSDSGDRLLPAMNYFEYTKGLGKIISKFEAHVTQFCAKYPEMVIEAQTRLNGLFDQNDYPKDIEDKFKIKTSFMPIPESNDIRVNHLYKADIDKIKGQVETEVNDRFNKATESIYLRIKEQLEHMHERLSNTENVFRDTLFSNLAGLVELLPRLNVMDDKALDALCEDMKSLIVEPDSVRTDELLRKKKANEVQSLLNNLTGMFQPSNTNPVMV